MRYATIAIATAIVSTIAASSAIANSAEKDQPSNAQLLTPTQVNTLYSGKTWFWKSGAGYLDPTGRFEAWANDDAGPSYGVGTWTIDARGVMCFKAKWTSGASSADATRCFGHSRVSNALYQRDESVGRWYLFKHDVAHKDDGFSKIVAGNLIKSQLKAAKARTAAKSAN